jgi:hypothetical protein
MKRRAFLAGLLASAALPAVAPALAPLEAAAAPVAPVMPGALLRVFPPGVEIPPALLATAFRSIQAAMDAIGDKPGVIFIEPGTHTIERDSIIRVGKGQTLHATEVIWRVQ